jgi:hypothetical protein
MSQIGSLRREILKMRQEGMKWQEIADRYGVTVGMAWRIANEGYEPRSKEIRVKLGLGRRQNKALRDLPTQVLRSMVEGREKWS